MEPGFVTAELVSDLLVLLQDLPDQSVDDRQFFGGQDVLQLEHRHQDDVVQQCEVALDDDLVCSDVHHVALALGAELRQSVERAPLPAHLDPGKGALEEHPLHAVQAGQGAIVPDGFVHELLLDGERR